jgi:serine/threonine protein kinase
MDALPSEVHRAFGTPHFMSPEQASGETHLDGRSDIYSLGVLGYLMLSGRVPFEGDHLSAIMTRQITEIHRPLREVAPKAPSSLSTVIERCLEKEPGQRWRRASDIADVLSRPTGRLSGFGLVSSLVRSA